jgi:NADPH:quinone reductase-like Zn-dependent oxidoreductase
VFAVYAAEGRPDAPLSALKIGERPRPEVPAKHVAVNIRAASLNMHDLWMLRGVGISPHMFPHDPVDGRRRCDR